ncbi:hypothetical protein LIER_17533 [Lithospermum erythrorhizon]|uniref:Uncharacterized protein n=1 Tax=Lithospermum erythrorhizon TaxID=34254 RepID=A0AAV3QBM8_LITER
MWGREQVTPHQRIRRSLKVKRGKPCIPQVLKGDATLGVEDANSMHVHPNDVQPVHARDMRPLVERGSIGNQNPVDGDCLARPTETAPALPCPPDSGLNVAPVSAQNRVVEGGNAIRRRGRMKM